MVNTCQKYKNVTDLELLLPEEKARLDVWLIKAFKANRYPVLNTLVWPCLNIFSGLMMECLFSMMSDIIDSRSGCMEIETSTAILTTRYSLKFSKSPAFKYNQKDTLQNLADSTLLYLHIFFTF